MATLPGETIRRAAPADRPALRALWETCFGDPAAYIDAFFARWAGRDRCLVAQTGGRVASMAHLLPVEARLGGRACPGQYLYAAATLPALRANGLMRRLLEAARRAGERAGCGFTVLVPAEDGLFGYYARSGYRAFSPYAEMELPAALPAETPGGRPAEPSKLSFEQAARLRRKWRPDAVLWPDEDFPRVLAEFTQTGGRLLTAPDGYAAVQVRDGAAVVRELVAPRESGQALLRAAAALPGVERLRVQLPNGAAGALQPVRVPAPRPVRHAMFLPHGLPPAFADALAAGRLYMNLMMD